MMSGNQIAEYCLADAISAIYTSLTTDDLHNALVDALESQSIGTGFTLFFVKTGKLKPVYCSMFNQTQAQTVFDAVSPLAGTLYRDAYCGPLDPANSLPGNLSCVVAAATLTFLDDPYGLLMIHGEKTFSREGEQSAAFDAICHAVESEFVKIQVKEMAEHDAQLAATKLSTISKVNDLFVHLEIEPLLVKMMEISLDVLSAQVGSLLLLGEDGSLNARVDFGLPEDVLLGIETAEGKKVIDVVMATKRPFYVENVRCDPGITCKDSKFRIESFIAMPLTTSSGVIGTIIAVNLPDALKKDDKAVFATICGVTATAIENAFLLEQRVNRERLLEQIQIAQDIQTSLSPRSFLNVSGVELSAWSVPADETGGRLLRFF